MSLGKVTPATDWPVKSEIILRDAWLRNPVRVAVTKHVNENHIIAEDASGVVYFTKTDRIEGFYSSDNGIDRDFLDILG